MNSRMEWWSRFWKEEDGMGTLEVILIIAVIIVIAFAFRKWIVKWVNELFNSTDRTFGDNQNIKPVEPAAGAEN